MSAAADPPSAALPTRLILVHGSRLSSAQWEPQLRVYARDPALAARLDVVTLDLPGHGTRGREPFTLERAVGAVAAGVESGDESQPVVLAGHSLGGFVAMAYAATFPRRLAGLALLGSAVSPVGPGAAAYRGVAWVTDHIGEQRMTRVNDRVLRGLYAADLVDPVIAGGYWFAPTAASWREVMARCRPSMLRDVACPVLVSGGCFDQLALQARRFAAVPRAGRVQLVPRAGHLVGLDQPERVAALLADFALSVSDGTLHSS